MGVAENEVGRPRPGPGRMTVRRHRVAIDQQTVPEHRRGSQRSTRARASGTAANRCGCAARRRRTTVCRGRSSRRRRQRGRSCRGPAPTRALVVLTQDGSRSANIAGSSSQGSRLASHQARGKVAASSGAPCSGAAANSSSTKPSSLRRRLERVQAGGCKQFVGITATRMRRGKHHGNCLLCRSKHHDGSGEVIEAATGTSMAI